MVSQLITAPDGIKIRGFAEAGRLVKVSRVAPQVGEVDQAVTIDTKNTAIGDIEPGQRDIEADV